MSAPTDGQGSSSGEVVAAPAPPEPETYPVARSRQDAEVTNTIDLPEDFPFSV